jgi:pimeloyl-ACP methyl ester carboxylesterase
VYLGRNLTSERRYSKSRVRITTTIVAMAGVVALALSGCTSSADSHDEKPIESLRIPITGEKLKSFYDQDVQWSKCGPSFKCSQITAPLDWSHPSGKSIHLAMVEHVPSAKAIGTLFVNPGGPGGSGIEMVGAGVDYAVDPAVAKKYNVIGFDPRGVGYSSAVKCGGAAQLDKYLYGTVPGAIGSKKWIAGQKAKSKAFASECKKSTGALLGQIDTISAARDLDLMRAVVGSKKLDYLGYSYGTYLGTVYAGLFPKNVGRLVFDGPDDPWYQGKSGGESSNVSQAVGFEGDLTSYLKSCLAGESKATGSAACPFSGTLKEAKTAVSRMLASASVNPIKAPDGRDLNGSTLSTAIIEAMYDTSSWPELTTAFTQLKAGTTTGAFALADDYNARSSKGKYYDNLAQASLAIGCLESGSDIDLTYDAKELKQLRKKAPVLGPYFAYGDLACAGWPYGPSTFPKPIHATGAAPILLVGTTGDPATPYPGAKALTKQLTDSVLVTYHGEGHTAYNANHSCVNSAVDAYLTDGTVPKQAVDCR